MTAQEIAASIRKYAAEWLEIADKLDPAGVTSDQLDAEAEEFYAPWGYKADGTPYKRQPPSRDTVRRREAKRQATLRRRKAESTETPEDAPSAPQGAARRPQTVRLNVLSSTKPTERELEGREVAHVTEEPA